MRVFNLFFLFSRESLHRITAGSKANEDRIAASVASAPSLTHYFSAAGVKRRCARGVGKRVEPSSRPGEPSSRFSHTIFEGHGIYATEAVQGSGGVREVGQVEEKLN